MKIAIFGGTFNPIHNGHLALADTALKAFDLDKIIFIPSYISPHKASSDIASAEDRLAMIKLAIKGNDKYEASRLEINRRSISYSVDTVLFVQKIYPKGTQLYFLAGSDSISQLKTWKDIDKILSVCQFIVGVREGHTLETEYKNIEIMPMAPVNISSTEIRNKLKTNQALQGQAPEEIINYIKEFKLYL